MAGEDLELLRASTGCGPVIRALGILKKCAAQANGELGRYRARYRDAECPDAGPSRDAPGRCFPVKVHRGDIRSVLCVNSILGRFCHAAPREAGGLLREHSESMVPPGG